MAMQQDHGGRFFSDDGDDHMKFPRDPFIHIPVEVTFVTAKGERFQFQFSRTSPAKVMHFVAGTRAYNKEIVRVIIDMALHPHQ